MPRADLHYALVLDDEIYRASQVDRSLLDPVVRVEGGLPGLTRPVTVVRDYQGPQGAYVERFVITDRNGHTVFRSPSRLVQLTGEMFEDRVVDTVSGLALERGDEHTASFLLGDEEIGSVPVFVEAAMGGDPRVAAEETFKKALNKGAVMWVTVPPVPGRRGRRAKAQPHTQAVWYVVQGDKVYVIDGPSEQQVPGLPQATTVELTARSKDLRSRVAKVEAAVRVVAPDDALFERVAQAGLGRRLNLPDGEGAVERWRANCTLVELSPRFKDVEAEAPSAQQAAGDSEAQPTGGEAAAEQKAAGAGRVSTDDIHVEAQVDQEVYDQLIAEGKSERIARAKAKASYVRKEKARILAEREAS